MSLIRRIESEEAKMEDQSYKETSWIANDVHSMTFQVKDNKYGWTAKVTFDDGSCKQFPYFSGPAVLLAHVVAWAVDYFQSKYWEKGQAKSL